MLRKQPPADDPGSTRAQERRDAILDAAVAVFSAAGFDAARMEDVAKAAHISKAGVYLYFESKEALLKALIVREVKPGALAAEALAASSMSATETLRTLSRFIHAKLQDVRAAAIPRLVIAVAPRYPEIAAFYRAEVIDRGRAAVRSIIERGVAAGEFRKVDIEAATRAMMGPVLFAGIWRHVFGGESAAAEAESAGHIDMLLQGLARSGSVDHEG